MNKNGVEWTWPYFPWPWIFTGGQCLAANLARCCTLPVWVSTACTSYNASGSMLPLSWISLRIPRDLRSIWYPPVEVVLSTPFAFVECVFRVEGVLPLSRFGKGEFSEIIEGTIYANQVGGLFQYASTHSKIHLLISLKRRKTPNPWMKIK